MNLSAIALEIYGRISKENTKLGDLRKIAKEIKRNHDLAMELWSTREFLPRQLAILIMDKKLLTQDFINQLDEDMGSHNNEERLHLADWFMANQLMKDKKLIALMLTWEHSLSEIQRRIFWYYQARLRWTGQTPPDNTEALLESIESRIAKEQPAVQWAMNFTAGQIGTFDPVHRERCIKIGETTGLYRDDIVPRGCTPSYLPEFIRIQVGKLKK